MRFVTRPQAHLSAILIPVVLALSLSACATGSQGVEELSPDTYFLRYRMADVDGGSVEAKRLAVIEAEAHCASDGRSFELTKEELGPVTADIYFRCNTF